jgi:hypothetical protein
MRKHALWVAVIVGVLVTAAASSSSAATTHWKLAKRYHYTLTPTLSSKEAITSLTNVHGIAVSVHATTRHTMYVFIGGTCTNSQGTWQMPAEYTTLSAGTQIPVHFRRQGASASTTTIASPNHCKLQTILEGTSSPAAAFNLTVWSR